MGETPGFAGLFFFVDATWILEVSVPTLVLEGSVPTFPHISTASRFYNFRQIFVPVLFLSKTKRHCKGFYEMI